MTARLLRPVPLTRDAFAPFGQVIQTDGTAHFPINDGKAMRFHDMATPDVGTKGGRGGISVFRAEAYDYPFPLRMMERHPLGTQAFIPLSDYDWLIVVAPKTVVSGVLSGAQLTAFRAKGNQGVQYDAGTWHHPLLVLAAVQDFLVVDRIAPSSEEVSANLELASFAEMILEA